jgi:hypothetical protein
VTRNITFSADEAVIEAAREAARSEGTTLNEQFRLWLESYARRRQSEQALEAVRDIRSRYRMTGPKPSRDEMNERR